MGLRHATRIAVRSVLSTLLLALALGATWIAPSDASGYANTPPVANDDGPFSITQKATAPNPVPGDRVGGAVSLSGGTAIVGAAYRASGGVTASGSALIWQLENGSWSLVDEISAPTPAPIQFFGSSVAIDGNTAVVGAPATDFADNGPGTAYVFSRIGGAWAPVAILSLPDGAQRDCFGFSVDIDGDTIVVGAYLRDVDGTDSGEAYVFTREDGKWGAGQRLARSGAAAYDWFGLSVAIDGGTIAVGAPGFKAPQTGKTYVFTRTVGTWTEQAVLEPTGGKSLERSGYSVDVDGDTIVSGARSADGALADSGAAYVFTRTGSTWSQQSKLWALPGQISAAFGGSVAVEGDTLLVGAPAQDMAGVTAAGAAYRFVRSGTTWSQTDVYSDPDCVESAHFGRSVAIDGHTAAFGIRQDDFVDDGTPKQFQGSAMLCSSYVTERDVPLDVAAPGVLWNDTDADANPIIAALVGTVGHGALALDPDGSFTYTPTAGWTGTDRFIYRANDIFEGSETANATIEVLPAAPTAPAAGALRVSDDTRYLTAVAAAQRAYPNGANAVVIATGTKFPDALGGSALAGTVDGPLLLTKPEGLPAEVAAVVEDLAPSKAYVLGGVAAVAPAVVTALEGVVGAGNVERISGEDRYETARKIADKVIAIEGADFDGIAFVATGKNFPDALAASPVAAAKRWPILLADPASTAVTLPSAVKGVRILGGTAVVSSATEAALKTALGSGSAVRHAGDDRYATAATVAGIGVDLGLAWDGVGIATGVNFPDALSGGAMLGRYGTVMLLTTPDALHAAASTALKAHAGEISSAHIIGGPAAVSDAVKTAVHTAIGG